MGRSGGRELARAAVGRVDRAVVQPRVAEDAHDGLRTDLVAGRDAAELRGRLAAVDRQREHPRGVLVEQQLARLGVGERAQVARAAAVRSPIATSWPRRASRSPGRASSWTLPKPSITIACAVSRPCLPGLRLGQRDPHELVGVERGAGVRERLPCREPGGDGREQVAAVERRRDGLEPPRRGRDLDRLDHHPEALGGGDAGGRCRGRRAGGRRARCAARRRAAARRRPGRRRRGGRRAGRRGARAPASARRRGRTGAGLRARGRSRARSGTRGRSRRARRRRTRPPARSRRGR